MCTVSIVPREDGYRLLCNRDELLSRPLAVPPRWTRQRDVTAAYPIDPSGGGTWIAVNGHGLTVALLNRGTLRGQGCSKDGTYRRRSRGEIPLAVIDAGTADEARRRLEGLDPGAYPGFFAMLVWFDQLITAESDGVRVVAACGRLTAPVAFTASSLGDRDAERLRLPLFRSMVVDAADPWHGQRAFHDHQWPGRPEMSVRMRRHDARTVSRTRVDVKGNRVVLDYEPLSPKHAQSTVDLARRR
jgi:hypothetical protein